MNDTENEEEVKKEVKLDVFGHTVNKTHNLGQHDNILIICWFVVFLTPLRQTVAFSQHVT